MAVAARDEQKFLKKQNTKASPPQFHGTERWVADQNEIKSQSLVRLPVDIYRATI